MDCLGSEWTQEIVIMHIEILLSFCANEKQVDFFPSRLSVVTIPLYLLHLFLWEKQVLCHW